MDVLVPDGLVVEDCTVVHDDGYLEPWTFAEEPFPAPCPRAAAATPSAASATALTDGDDPAAGATLVGLPLVIVSLVGSALAGGVLGALLERRRD